MSSQPEARSRFRTLLEELGEIRLVASSLAFSSLLSLIPFLVIVLAGFQYIGGMDEIYRKVEIIIYSYLRETTGVAVSRYIRGTIDQVDFKTLGISGALLLVWTSIGLIRNIDYAFNRIWKIQIRHPFYKRLWLYWSLLMAAPIGIALFVGLRSLVLINQGVRSTEHQILFAAWVWMTLTLLYKVIPATKVKLWPCLLSSFLVSLIAYGVQKSFLWISLIVFHQNKIYGSLASFPIFLIWLLVMWYIVLMGVSLCALLQQKSFKTP